MAAGDQRSNGRPSDRLDLGPMLAFQRPSRLRPWSIYAMRRPGGTVRAMHVTAFSSPREPRWRWRITDVNGDVIEESHSRFDTISAAVAAGTERLVRINDDDHPLMRQQPWGTRHYLRGQPI